MSFLPQESDLIFILFYYFEFADEVSQCGGVIPSAPGTGLIIFFSSCALTSLYVD